MNEPIRILQVFGELNQGGAEVMIMNLYRHIDRSKIQFDFIVHTQARCFFETEIEQLGGNVYRVPRLLGFNMIQYWRAWKQFFSIHGNYKAIHGHTDSTAAIYLKIASQFNITTIAHSHAIKNTPNFKGFIGALLAYPTRFIADWFLGCSSAAGVHRYGQKVVNSNRFFLVKNAIEIERFTFDKNIRDKGRIELALGNGLVVGHVGRFHPLKNHLFLLKVFKEILDRLPTSHLLLIGDGSEREKIEKQIVELDIQESVHLLGMRSDVPELLQTMDVFVFPSISEGLGIGLIEAQATGLPCITSTAVPEEVKITDLVDFLPLGMPISQWAEKIILHQQKFERRERSQEIIDHGYDIKTTVLEIEQFYQKL